MAKTERTMHAKLTKARRCGVQAEGGFTLIEVLVSMLIMIIVLVGLLALLQFNSRVARAQVNVSEMQQSLRAVQSDMVRLTRMAGRGGLPVRDDTAGTVLPLGPALGVVNRVPASAPPLGGVAEAKVRENTDVLIVRGVITNPLYQVIPSGDGDVRGVRVARTGSVTIRSQSPAGVPQDLTPLKEAVQSGLHEAILLVGAGSDESHAVVELTGGDASQDDQVVLRFTLDGTYKVEYASLSQRGEFPVGLKSVAMVGILEEYRYYVRESAPAPRISRGRFFPGTQVVHGDDSNAHVDLADNILDLQVALGVDLNGNGVLEDTADGADDWLFNADADSPAVTAKWNGSAQPLYYVRITTLARTDRADPKYVSPAIDDIEDHHYGELDVPDAATRFDRSYRRRTLRTVVDLRNLS